MTSQTNPCRGNRTPLSDVFCGRGPTRQDCPTGYDCIIAPDDSFAVCCPVRRGKRNSIDSKNARLV